MTPAMLILGWERFTMLRFTHSADAARVLANSQHLLTPDRNRFVPVRLMRELALGKSFEQAQADSGAFAGLRPALESMGWRVLRQGEDGFDRLFAAWQSDCTSIDAATVPGDTMAKDRIFIVPA